MNMNHTLSLAVIAAGFLTSLPVARAGARAHPHRTRWLLR